MCTTDQGFVLCQLHEKVFAGLDCGRSVSVERDTHFGMWHLHRDDVGNVAPDQQRLALRRNPVTHVPWRMPRDGNWSNARHDFIHALQWLPFASRQIRCSGSLGNLEKYFCRIKNAANANASLPITSLSNFPARLYSALTLSQHRAHLK